MYTSKTIKPFKGKLVEVTYKTKPHQNSITGEIAASTKYHILLNVNKVGLEIPLRYDQILDIKPPVYPVK